MLRERESKEWCTSCAWNKVYVFELLRRAFLASLRYKNSIDCSPFLICALRHHSLKDRLYKSFWINVGVWVTAHLPLPNPKIVLTDNKLGLMGKGLVSSFSDTDIDLWSFSFTQFSKWSVSSSMLCFFQPRKDGFPGAVRGISVGFGKLYCACWTAMYLCLWVWQFCCWCVLIISFRTKIQNF